MIRWLVFAYGLFAFLVGFVGLVWFALLLADWMPASLSVDRGTADVQAVNGSDSASPAVAISLVINVALMVLFGLQHSVMARPGFKRVLTRVIPRAAERSTYVLLSGIVLILIAAWWQPLPGFVWQIENTPARVALSTLQMGGWLLLLAAAFTINAWDLFGVAQVWRYLQGKNEPTPEFTERGLYRIVRHPIQLGVLIGIWVTPVMSTSHLLLSTAMTLYILIALQLEERDLRNSLGDAYEDYRRRVPMLLPLPR